MYMYNYYVYNFTQNWHVFIELPRYSYLFWGPLFYGTQCRNVVNLKFFSGEIPKHHFTRAFLYYMAGPLLKSRRRPCSFCRPCSVGASTLCCGHMTRWCGRIGHSERYKRHAEAPHAFNSGWDPSGNTSKKIPRALRSAPPLWRRRTKNFLSLYQSNVLPVSLVSSGSTFRQSVSCL